MKRLLFPLALVLASCGDNLTYPTRDPYIGAEAAPLECVPNLDGRIDATELRAAIGVPLRYLASPPGISRGVDVVGGINPQNQRVWDLAVDYADDRVAKLLQQPSVECIQKVRTIQRERADAARGVFNEQAVAAPLTQTPLQTVVAHLVRSRPRLRAL